MLLEMIGPCKRCQMVSIDQQTGDSVPEPFKTLSKWKERRFQFGALASVSKELTNSLEKRTAQLDVGNKVEIGKLEIGLSHIDTK